MATLSPLRYPGGKDKTYNYVKHLVNQNNISTYIEPFAGGAAVALRLLLNGDVKKIIINDYDRSIYALWSTLLTNADSLISLVRNTPITMTEWYKQKEIQQEKMTADELSLAFSTLFLNRTNRSGIIKAGVIGGKKQDGIYKLDCRFNKEDIIKRIERIHSFRNQIKVCNMDAKDFIDNEIKYTRKSLTFFDPPYYLKGPDLYTNFYSHEDHVELANQIKSVMKNRYWILTYDIAEQIEELYKNNRATKYSLNYSIATPSKGQEFMFFSKNIEIGNINDFLNIV
ncbi:DNA adenine methylase [Psychrobacillus lasiicapitis]|uniref:site-specific DNA-methyltransferase (adenine-specific) n=1 Tax=Psychrobacillus lasiicapitis TaxID=1636719 RepID=A0A544TAD9_9BACI|nr:DNA adenine methylase [Psychrobacillus lasiicapitis]TQR14430.1 DNA adenine methylase [Psychrobacillus lasiicapitis]GGA31407.1 methylase [Psychrobacillus lasiicapitis]